jgi:heme/copper-type cytochrome/quinol oxidase subunit 2
MPVYRLPLPFLLIAAIALCVLAAGASPAWACPFCKEALGSSGGDLVSGFFYSILFMLSMPFLIVTGMGTYMYVLVRRARAARKAASEDSLSPGSRPPASA